jgi:methyl-accepting chemotaxis protein
MESGGTEMAENARESIRSARDTFRQGADQAKDSTEQGAGEVTNTLGRMAEIGTEHVRRTAQVYIDTFEKMANEMLNLPEQSCRMDAWNTVGAPF